MRYLFELQLNRLLSILRQKQSCIEVTGHNKLLCCGIETVRLDFYYLKSLEFEPTAISGLQINVYSKLFRLLSWSASPPQHREFCPAFQPHRSSCLKHCKKTPFLPRVPVRGSPLEQQRPPLSCHWLHRSSSRDVHRRRMTFHPTSTLSGHDVLHPLP